MTITFSLRSFILLSLLFASCAEPPVYRAMTLELHEQLPRADAPVVGDRLRLVVRDLEPLQSGALWAWTRSAQSWTSAGALTGEVSAFTVPSPTALEEVLVTHETSAAPSSPSLLEIIFRGRPGEALFLSGYAGPTRANLLAARVTAEISNRQVLVRSNSIPSLGAGLHYALWVRKDGAPPLLLGRLGTTGEDTFAAQELLAGFEELVVTIELDDGVEDLGTELLEGHILDPAAGPAPAHSAHEH